MRTVLLLLLLLPAPWCSPSAEAQDTRPQLEISLDVTRRPLDQVIAAIAKRSGKSIIVAPGLTDPITLTLRDVSWRVVVDLLARRTKCRVRELAGGTLLIDRPARISVQFEQADLKTALLLLAKYANKSIVLGPKVQGKVTLSLRTGDVVAAMRAIATTHDCLILTSGSLVTVGKGRADLRLAKSAPAPKDVLSGTFVSLVGTTLTLEVAGAKVALDLSSDVDRRKRQVTSLNGAKPGERIVVTHQAAEGRAPSPASKTEKKKTTPKPKPTPPARRVVTHLVVGLR